MNNATLTYTATRSATEKGLFLHFEIMQGDEEIALDTTILSNQQWDGLEDGSLQTDSFNIPGFDLIEYECDGDDYFGTATRTK